MTQNSRESKDVVSIPTRQGGQSERQMEIKSMEGWGKGFLCLGTQKGFQHRVTELWVLLSGSNPVFVFLPSILLGVQQVTSNCWLNK